MKEIIKEFEGEVRKKSPLCEISLGRTSIKWNSLNCNSIYPFAFIAYYYGNLNKIDAILEKFEIINKGTPDFKARFNDQCFLKSNEGKELKYSNALLSALVELVVADHLLNAGEEIIQLGACCKCPSDIKSKYENALYFTEVKYIGEIPKLYSLVRETIKSSKHAGAKAIGSLSAIYNYVNMRIADATFQLEKEKVDIKKRRVFVVIKLSEPLKSIIPSLVKKENWCSLSWNSLIDSLGLSQELSSRYLADTVGNYHKKSGKLTVGLMDDSYNLRIVLN